MLTSREEIQAIIREDIALKTKRHKLEPRYFNDKDSLYNIDVSTTVI